MYKLFLKNSNGQYHYGQPFEEVGEAVYLALEFRFIVPLIMITNEDDHSIFEAGNGVVVFPVNEDFSGIPSMGLVNRLPNDTSEYASLIQLRNNLNKFDPFFRKVEASLLAAAARDSVNLYSYGWSIPDLS